MRNMCLCSLPILLLLFCGNIDGHSSSQTSANVYNHAYHNDHVHRAPIFDDEESYKVKSCLSPDLELHELSTCRFYAMMIDAGSTGTRIHIFEFSHQPNTTGSPFKLENETFEEVKPGLSNFENDPDLAAASVAKLLDRAKQTVPSTMWAHTPLALKATAGLRLLAENAAEKILDRIETLFEQSPFLVNEDSATMMTGVDEGIFGWFTLNFLLDRIDSVLMDPDEDFVVKLSDFDFNITMLLKSVSENWTAAALDLGGGSTQVTFRPLQQTTMNAAPSGFMKPIGVFNQEVMLYTHSYLGNGLIAARLSTLKLSTKPTPKAKEGHELYTACMPPDVSLKWNYSGTVWSVRGTKRYSFDSCAYEVQRFVQSSKIDKQPELGTRLVQLQSCCVIYMRKTASQASVPVHKLFGCLREPRCIRTDEPWYTAGLRKQGFLWFFLFAFSTDNRNFFSDLYAFSYFYDRGMQAGLVPANRGGMVTVQQFKRAAHRACARRQSDFGPEHWQPWQCLDLTYIHSLFTHGYALDDSKQINLAKKLRNNMETSWALGAAYHLLNTYHERTMVQRKTFVQKWTLKISDYVKGLLRMFNIVDRVTDVLRYFNLLS